MLKVGDDVIQIPLDWPARQGKVAEVDNDARTVRVEWHDGREDWIHENDFVREGVWLVKP